MLRKIWLSFLRAYGRADFQEERECFHTSQRTHFFSFPFLLRTQSHAHFKKKKKKKKGSWPWSFTLWQETLRQSQREERHNSYFLPQNLQRLPMKRETVQLDFIADSNMVILTQGLLILQVPWTPLRKNTEFLPVLHLGLLLFGFLFFRLIRNK